MAGILNLAAVIPPERVRLQMGINKSEYQDDQMLSSGFYEELVLDLYTWFPKYAYLVNYSGDNEEASMQQLALSTYGKFFLCRRLAMSGRLAFWQNSGDGENGDRRYALDWSKVIDEWEEEMLKAKQLALGIKTEFSPDEEVARVTGANILGVSSPGRDVVRR